MTQVFDLSDSFVEELCVLDPFLATGIGEPGHDDEVTDYSPDGVEGHLVNFGTGIVSALSAGAEIGQNAQFLSQTNPTVVMCHATDYGHQGRWCHKQNRYLGMRFAIKKKIHYGWARLTTTTGKHAHITVTLTGYAYETIPNKRIIAGKTKGPDLVTGPPASLGHLAHGAAMIPAWHGQH